MPSVFDIGLPDVNLDSAVRLVKESAVSRQVTTESKQYALPESVTMPITDIKPQEEIIEEAQEGVVVNVKAQEREGENEKNEEFKLKRIVDERAVKVRIEEIIEAAKKALRQGFDGELSRTAQGKQGEIDPDSIGIDGRKIVAELPRQHFKNRSGELNIVDPKGNLVDGSFLLTIAKIALKKFRNLPDIYKKAPIIVKEDIPVTRGDGEGVSDRDVAKVYSQFKGNVPPAYEVIKRVIKIKGLCNVKD